MPNLPPTPPDASRAPKSGRPTAGGATAGGAAAGGATAGVLVAIPVFNEARHVDDVLRKVFAQHPHVLVVDDGSTDGTPQRLAAWPTLHRITHPRNLGYGRSLIDAFAYAQRAGFDWVITMDCDEQHEPERIPAFLEAIRTDRWDLISGSRYLEPRPDDHRPPEDRAAINACLTRLLNDLYGLGITDAFCGFKAHRVASMRALSLTEPGYAFPMQLWPQVKRAGLRLTELPVRRIYADLSRTFGSGLDQPLVRLTHYLEVLSREHERLFGATPKLPEASALLAGARWSASATSPGAARATASEPEAASPAEPSACCGCR
ncbi:MAG: glycosyltransferase family 2 protein [Tepidisphaerales bacterium]